METLIQSFKGHTIVCGFGRNGSQAAARLKAYKKDFVVIEENSEAISDLEKESLFPPQNKNHFPLECAVYFSLIS